jgi:coenzyme F420-reducing hydrogenase alpha subunit
MTNQDKSAVLPSHGMHALNPKRLQSTPGTARKPLTTEQKKLRRHARRQRNVAHDAVLVNLRSYRHNQLIAETRFPATRKNRKVHAPWQPEHTVWTNSATGLRYSKTARKAA